MTTAWLDPVRAALDARQEPLEVVVRDDDGGWDDDGLARVVDDVLASGFAIDLAVIPASVSPALAGRLRAWRSDRVGIHQHGLRHVNHEAEGRRCEFGASRRRADQRKDITEGREILADALGAQADPVFTPPWNRCTADTAACLAELGFRVLSREHRAAPLAMTGLAEVPVHVDWPRDGRRPDRPSTAADVASAIRDAPYLGLMLHHAVMDEEDRLALDQTLAVLSDAGARPVRLATLAP